MGRVERTYYLVVEHPLVVIHVSRIVGVVAVEVLGQLGQVVGTTGLVQCRVGAELAIVVGGHIGVHAQYLCVGLAEHFAIAHTARGVGIASLNHLPEVQCQVVVVGLAVSPIASQGAGYLGDMLVGMAGADVVDVL